MLSQGNKEGRRKKRVAERRRGTIRRGQRHSEEMKRITGNENKLWTERKKRSVTIHKDGGVIFLMYFFFLSRNGLKGRAESRVQCPGTLQQPALFMAAPDSSRGDLHHSSLHGIAMNY